MDMTVPEGVAPGKIQGLWTRALPVIETQGGPVLHMLRADNSFFRQFGEIYFSVVLPGAVKAWKSHKRQSQNLAVPGGLVEVVVHDPRDDSPSKGETERFVLGRPDNYKLLHIPPGLWYGFAGRSDSPSILANCVDIPHSADDSLTLERHDPAVPYSWDE